MKYIRIQCIMQSENSVQLNDFLGSTIRGAIISEISKNYCTKSSIDCTSCNFGVTCPNMILFHMKDYKQDNRVSNPIVINAMQLSSTMIKLDILLFAIGITSAQSIVDILKNGIKLGKTREQFKVDELYTLDSNNGQHKNIVLAETKESDDRVTRITIDFLSQTHIQKDCMTLDFTSFLKCCMYRYMSINKLTNSEPVIEFNKLVEESSEIKTVDRVIKIKSLIDFPVEHKEKMRCTA